LGDGLTQIDPTFASCNASCLQLSEAAPYDTDPGSTHVTCTICSVRVEYFKFKYTSSLGASSEQAHPHGLNRSHESLRLLLSCYLAELHHGQISIQGTSESGYRYVVSLPELTEEAAAGMGVQMYSYRLPILERLVLA